MACETKLKRNQTANQRIAEAQKVVEKVSAGITAGRVKVVIGPQGAVAFQGISEQDRDGVSDACIYRRMLVSGSALARQAIARAEQLAGRKVSVQAVASGVHTHDGVTWHAGH